MPRPSRVLVPVLSVLFTTSAFAVEPHDDALPRLGAPVLVGTSGIEPGIFAEWRLSAAQLILRPEVFVNEDEHIGGGAALAWEPEFFHLPERHSISLGPRLVHHNSDDSGWEVDLQAIWSLDLVPRHRGHHYLEVIGSVGVLEDEHDENDDDSDATIGASVGIGYGYQF